MCITPRIERTSNRSSRKLAGLRKVRRKQKAVNEFPALVPRTIAIEQNWESPLLFQKEMM
jgi:hypothetical protein